MKIKELNKISNKPSNSLLQTGILLQSKICLERERTLDRGVLDYISRKQNVRSHFTGNNGLFMLQEKTKRLLAYF